MSRQIIYVPGLGDHHSYGQQIIIQLWRFFGLHPHYFPLVWNQKTSFSAKKNRLLDYIDELQAKGHDVSLVGVSAGASAVLNIFSERSNISAIILISGKVNRPETVHKRTYDLNPDFKESLHLLQKNLHRLDASMIKRIMSMHPWTDNLVPIADTQIAGALEKTVPGWGHKSGIFFGILLGGPSIRKFVKTSTKKLIL